jgi:hypothetical protein
MSCASWDEFCNNNKTLTENTIFLFVLIIVFVSIEPRAHATANDNEPDTLFF